MNRCPICDRPEEETPVSYEAPKDRPRGCHRLYLERRYLQQHEALRECVHQVTDWRKRAIAAEARVVELQRDLKHAKKVIARHHDRVAG